MDDLNEDRINRLRAESGFGMEDCAWALRVTFTDEQVAQALRLKNVALYVKPSHPTPLERFLRDLVPPTTPEEV